MKEKLKVLKMDLKEAKAELATAKKSETAAKKEFLAAPSTDTSKVWRAAVSEVIKFANAVAKTGTKIDAIQEKITA